MNRNLLLSHLEARFRELVSTFPALTDADRSFVERATARMWKTLQYLPVAHGTESLLDVGSMRGLFAPTYIEIWQYRNVTLLGTDTPTGIVERVVADRKFEFPAYRCNIETEPWPLADNTFDAVVCTEVLEHLIFDPAFAMNEMNRVLKPGGVALITVPNAASDICLVQIVNDSQPGFLRHYISDALRSGRRDLETVYHVSHFHEYTGWELKELAEATGFKVEVLKGLAVHPQPYRSFRLSLLLAIVRLLFPRARRIRESNIIALLRKKSYTPLDKIPLRYPPPLYQPLNPNS